MSSQKDARAYLDKIRNEDRLTDLVDGINGKRYRLSAGGPSPRKAWTSLGDGALRRDKLQNSA